MEEAGGRAQLVVGTVFVVVVTVLYLALLALRKTAPNAKRLPPGPQGWPVLGSLPSIGTLPHRSFAKLAEQYGPIMYLRMGSVPTLVLSSPEMAKEVLLTQDQIWASRPHVSVGSYLSYQQRDIAYAPHGPAWRTARKVCMLELFTPARRSQFQGLRAGEVLEFMKSTVEASKHGKAINLQDVFMSMTTNIITKMMWNKRHFVFDGLSVSPETLAFGELVRQCFMLLGSVDLGDYLPALKPLTMTLQGIDKRMRALHAKLDKFLENIIEEHRQNLAMSTRKEGITENEDLLDLLLKPSTNPESDREEELPMETVKALLLDLTMAGAETVATTLEWAFAELMKNPKILSRAQDELNSVVGSTRLVSEADVPNLKYIQAVVRETFRLHPAVPLLIPHQSMQDCVIGGYSVSAGTQAFVNVWAIQRDPAVWERPLEFNPDRFLSSAVDVKGRDFQLLPFGSGRRMCPAMSTGLITVQYSLAQLLHSFYWTLQGDVEKLDMSERLGLTAPRVVPLYLLAKPRLPLHIISPSS